MKKVWVIAKHCEGIIEKDEGDNVLVKLVDGTLFETRIKNVIDMDLPIEEKSFGKYDIILAEINKIHPNIIFLISSFYTEKNSKSLPWGKLSAEEKVKFIAEFLGTPKNEFEEIYRKAMINTLLSR
jgi:hypothetical protein